MQKATYLCDVIKGETGNSKFIISTESIDRGLDIMKVNGANLKEFNKNPTVYHMHDSQDGEPIAMGIVKKEKIDGKWSLTSEPIFSEEEKAQKVKRLVEGGFLNAASIGFRGIDWEDSALPEELASLAFVQNMWRPKIRTYKKWDLYEWSIVGNGMNPDALRVKSADALKKGQVNEEDLELLKEMLEHEEKAGAVLSTANKTSLNAAITAAESVVTNIKKVLESAEKPKENSDKEEKNGESTTNEEDDMTIEDVRTLLKGGFEDLKTDLIKELKPVLDYVSEQKEAQSEVLKQEAAKNADKAIEKAIENSMTKVNNKEEERQWK